MNKESFINKLSSSLSYSKEKCILINDILESNFFISKKNKEKIIDAFMQELHIDLEEAEKVYEVSIKIIKEEVKNKVKHPFGEQR